jgi:hypothetical protein
LDFYQTVGAALHGGQIAVHPQNSVFEGFGGHPAPSGRALPNLINAVRMFKVKVKVKINAVLAIAEINKLILTLTY